MTRSPAILSDFESRRVATRSGRVLVHQAGAGPAVLLLLHGFPKTSLMWRDIAPVLASDLVVVAADLPGYGGSDGPPESADHSAQSKRRMAETLVEAMAALGHDRSPSSGTTGADASPTGWRSTIPASSPVSPTSMSCQSARS